MTAQLQAAVRRARDISASTSVSASSAFVAEVIRRADLMIALIGETKVRDAAEAFFAEATGTGGGQNFDAHGHVMDAAVRSDCTCSPQGEGAATRGALSGLTVVAAPETISSVGHAESAPRGLEIVAHAAEPGAHHTAGGHRRDAEKAIVIPPRAASPSPAALRGAAAAAKSIAVTVFDTFRVRDGRPIGDVRFGELKRLATANAREASVLRQIELAGVPHSPDVLVRDAVRLSDLQRFIQRAAEVADAS